MVRLLPDGWTKRSIGGAELALPPRPDLTAPLDWVVPIRVLARDRRAAGEREALKFNEIDIVGSVETVDSYGTVFIQSGMEDRRFRENPVFLRTHRDDELPIGTCEDWWREEIDVRVRGQRKRVTVPCTVFRVAFDFNEDPAADDDWQRVARAYYDRFVRKVLRGASIRFAVPPGGAEWGDEMEEAERERWGISEWGILFRKWELIELSAVTIPSNEHALARSHGSGSCNESRIAKLESGMQALERQLDEVRSLAGSKPPEGPAAPKRAAETPPEDAQTPASESPAGGETPPGTPSDMHLAEFARALAALR